MYLVNGYSVIKEPSRFRYKTKQVKGLLSPFTCLLTQPPQYKAIISLIFLSPSMPLLWNTGQLDICSPPSLQSAHRSAPRKSTASACAAALLEVRKPPYVAARIRCSLKQYPQSVLPYKKLCHSAFLRSARSVQCSIGLSNPTAVKPRPVATCSIFVSIK